MHILQAPRFVLPALVLLASTFHPQSLFSQDGVVTLIHAFGGSDGANPSSALIELPNGNVLGTTWNANAKTGTVYSIDPNGVFTTTFTYPSTAFCSASNGLFQATSGLIYGTCNGGGANNLGSVYILSGSGSKGKLLHSFDGTDGSNPVGPLVEGPDGNLYGVTSSTVFKMTPTGVTAVLYTFAKGSGLYLPQGALTLGADMNLYGITHYDQNDFNGGAYVVSSSGSVSILGSFLAQPNSYNPVVTASHAAEILGLPSNSTGCCEAVETVSASGNKRVVYHLPQYYGPDYVNLVGGLIAGGDGALYLNGTSIIAFPPATYPNVIGRIDFSTGTRFAPVDSSAGGSLVADPLQVSSGAIYSATSNGGPSGLGSVVAANFGISAVSPAVNFFQPATGSAKTPVTVWGTHFVGATSVTVGGVPVPFLVTSSGTIKFAVTKITRSGAITVTTPGGVAVSSMSFTVD